MARINFVLVGAAGVVAGVVVNVTARAMWNYVLPNQMMAGSYLWGLVVGIATVSLYSALSARSGPSPVRALLAGMIVWLIAIAVPNYAFLASETLSRSLVTLSSALGLAEVIPAGLAGARAYDWASSMQQARAQTHQPRAASATRLTPHTPLTVKAI